MSTDRDYFQILIKFILDSIIILGAWFGSYFLRFYVLPNSADEPFRIFFTMSILVWILYLFFFDRNKLYRTTQALSWQTEVQMIIYSALEVFLSLTVILYYLYGKRVSRLTIALFIVVSTTLLLIERILINRRLAKLRETGKLVKRVLVIGYGEPLTHYIEETIHNPIFGLKLVGQYDSNNYGDKRLKQYDGDLDKVIEKTNPQIIVIGYPTDARDVEKKMIGKCYDLIQQVMVIPDLPFSLIGTKIVDFHSIPIMQLNDVSISFFQRFFKNIFDFIVTLVGTIIISPILLILGILVKTTSPGPVFYKQKRVTIDGKVFWMYKFRSMADRPLGEEDGKWTTKDDPRVTSFGKFIRKTSLDELPQLFNVLKGDMSLIGPRPERPELVDKFIHEIPGYQLRHKVKAGITGWAQVNGYRGDTSLTGRIQYDLDYIKNWSFLFDIKIFIFTFIKGFINKNAY